MAPASGTYAVIPFIERAEDPRALITVGAVCITLSTISVALRMYTKWRFVGKIRADDWLMCFSLILFGVYCSLVMVGGSLIARPNDRPLQASELALSMNLLNQGEVFYISTIGFLKISIGIFFLHIVQTPRIRMVIYTCIGVSSVFSVAMLFFAIFQCGVYDNIWEFLTKRFTHGCVSDAAALGMTFTHGAITVITDWTFLSLPFFILRNTLMIKREKFAIGFVLAFGSISGIAAIARMPYIRILAVPKNEIFDQIQNIAIWSAVEPAVGIIAGSLVTIRPLFRVMFPNASRSGGAAAASPMDIPSLATIATTQVDSKEEAQHDKLEAFYDSSFGSSRPMTPQSYTKQSGEMERARRPSETATLVGSPNKKRGVLNTEFQFPASPPPVFTPAPPYAAPQAVVRPKTAETLKTKQSKKAQVKETFLLDQTVDEPEKEEPVASVWSPPNWDSAQESPRRVAKPLLPTPTATVASTSIRESLQPASTPASRFQPIRPNPQHWELRDWDRRAEPVGMPGQNWQGENNLALPSNKAGSLRQSLLSRSSSQKTTRVFPSRGKSIREPGLPLDMFFGEQADDFSDTESNFDASTRQSRRTNFSG